MSRVARILLVLVVAGALAAPAQTGRTVSAVGDGNNRFFCNLYPKAGGTDVNTFLSPASIWVAMTMTSAGARNQTAAQLNAGLCLPLGDVHVAAGRLLTELNLRGAKGSYQLSVANSLWGQQGFTFLPAFLSLLKTAYGADLRTVDFARDEPGARRQINGWVERETRDKIRDIIPPGVLNAMTRLVLANAIYFKGKWQDPFKKDATQDAPFTKKGGGEVTCSMMERKGRVGYLRGEGFQAVELDYAGRDVSMVIFLPDSADGLYSFERKLSAPNLAGWLRAMPQREVRLFIPRFTMTHQFELAPVLASMGMPDAFSPTAADFSGMDGRKDLFISNVLHKAFVEVNEEGTEAAAATTVVVALTSAPGTPPEEIVFRADHPFFFLIRDKVSGSVLFAGRVAEPRS